MNRLSTWRAGKALAWVARKTRASAFWALPVVALPVVLAAQGAQALTPDRYSRSDVAPKFAKLAQALPVWLSRDAVQFAMGLPDAALTHTEITQLLALQGKRTAADVQQIKREIGDLVPLFVHKAGGNAAKVPKTIAYLRHGLRDLDYFLFAEKLRLLRPRPHQMDRRIRPCIAVPKHPSFPSGHGGQARLLALLLAQLVPNQATQLENYAQQVGVRRELAGVHFASDTVEGLRIGNAVAQQLISSPRFMQLHDAARPEWPPQPVAPVRR
ncbi:MAG: phosphatase PAP2 family protein [Myxococcales bacterium]|nr:phosphatase PAP2 family protein [Myxococcales bacterium]